MLSPNMFRVSWLPPHSPNGVLTGYLVEVYNETNYAQPFINTSLHPNQLNINISTGISVLLNNFQCYIFDNFVCFHFHSEPYVAYTVQISAVTIGGVGDSTVVVVFTLEAGRNMHAHTHMHTPLLPINDNATITYHIDCVHFHSTSEGPSYCVG